MMMLLKVILANLILLGSIETQKKYSKEYDLINFLACETNEYALVVERFLSWEESGFNSYSDLPTKIKNLSNNKESFDLESLLDQNDRRKIEQILKSTKHLLIDLECLKCKDKLNKTKDFVPKKTIFTYSYPIISEGIDKEIYGIILESEVFEINYTLRLKVFKKQNESWILVYQEDLAFS
jgi:hypothetical protein